MDQQCSRSRGRTDGGVEADRPPPQPADSGVLFRVTLMLSVSVCGSPSAMFTVNGLLGISWPAKSTWMMCGPCITGR